MRSLKISCLFCLLFGISSFAGAFDITDENEVSRYFNTYREYDFIILEKIREPIFFSVGEKKIAILPLIISVEGRPDAPNPAKYFLIFTKKNNCWCPVGQPIKKGKVSRLFGRDAEQALFFAGY